MELLYIFGSVILVSVISLLGLIPYLLKKSSSHNFLVTMLSFSVGTLLGTVFIHFLPEVFEHGWTMSTALIIILGFLVFFVLESFIHWHHDHHNEIKGDRSHGHAYHLAPMNLIGDGLHNFMDGLVIAGSYMASPALGIASTISVIFHELPQEIADFGILLYSGWSKKKALLFNFLSAIASLIGAGLAILLASTEFERFVIPFAAGTFIYIAASNLVPELHRHCKLKDAVLHLIAIIAGVAVMAWLTLLFP